MKGAIKMNKRDCAVTLHQLWTTCSFRSSPSFSFHVVEPRPFPCLLFDGCSGKLAVLDLWTTRTFPCAQAPQNLECQTVGLELFFHLFLEWVHCVRAEWPQPCKSVCSIQYVHLKVKWAWMCYNSVLAVVLKCLGYCLFSLSSAKNLLNNKSHLQ